MRPRAQYGTVIFDCDMTLSAITGVEELGREHRAEVEALTAAAMNGQVPLDHVYGRRLELARPNRTRVQEVGQEYITRLVPEAREVVRALLEAGVEVRIVSTGIRQAVLVVARDLGIPDEAVGAVDLEFESDGSYKTFDPASPLPAARGKLRLIEQWASELPRPIMLVGDGATDLEAKPAVDCFVAFAGVAARPAVMAGADVVIRHNSLAPVLVLALKHVPEAEPARSVYERGKKLLGDHPPE